MAIRRDVTPTPAPTGQSLDSQLATIGGDQSGRAAGAGTVSIDNTYGQSAFDAGLGQQFGSATNEPTIPIWAQAVKIAKNKKGVPDLLHGGRGQTRQQFTETAAQAEFGALLQDPAKLQEFIKLAVTAALLRPDETSDVVAIGGAWSQAVKLAIAFKQNSRSSQDFSPFEALEFSNQMSGAAALAQQADPRAHLNGAHPLEHASDTYISATDTAAAGDTLHRLLGRNPTDGESAAYKHGLQEIAQANPTTVSHMGTYKDGSLVAQTDTATGGYDEHAAQIKTASSVSPDVATNQMATTYFSALTNAIKAAV